MTIKSVLLATLASAATIPALPAQDAPPTAESEPSVDDLIEQLGDDDFRVRKAATSKLEELGDEAAADLRIAAEDHDDAEVRMRATRILRRIEQGDAAPPRSLDLGDAYPDRGQFRPPFDHDELRAMIDDVLNRRLGGHQRWLDQWLRDADIGVDGTNTSESVEIRIGPDGVRVEVGQDGDRKVYEADDMDAFREQFPEVADRYFRRDGSRSRLRAFDLGDGDLFRRFHPDLDLALPELRRDGRVVTPLAPDAERVPTEGRRLGVQVDALHPVLAEFLGFDTGEGLRVVAVSDGSLAEDLGIEAGDVLLEIGGAAIRATADVAEQLGKIEAGASVEVRVNRRGLSLELTAAKRHSAKNPRVGLRERQVR